MFVDINQISITTVMKLLGGPNPAEGNVFIDGLPVCDDAWDEHDGKVACRQLGFNGLVRVTTNSHFGSVPSDFAMDEVSCNGTEAKLQDCLHKTRDDCGANEGAGVICQMPGLF